jgi:hypothetical protein
MGILLRRLEGCSVARSDRTHKLAAPEHHMIFLNGMDFVWHNHPDQPKCNKANPDIEQTDVFGNLL